MRKLHKNIIAALLSCASSLAFAELPLTIEDLITDKGKVTLDATFLACTGQGPCILPK